MSNAAAAKKDETQGPAPKGERMRSLRFVTEGLPLNGPNSHDKQVTARTSPGQTGIDIYFENESRRFRFECYRENTLVDVKYMNETRVDLVHAWMDGAR